MSAPRASSSGRSQHPATRTGGLRCAPCVWIVRGTALLAVGISSWAASGTLLLFRTGFSGWLALPVDLAALLGTILGVVIWVKARQFCGCAPTPRHQPAANERDQP